MIAFVVTGGEASDSKQLLPLMEQSEDVPNPKHLLADAGYDSDANREDLLLKGIIPVIKPNPTRKNIPPFNREKYKGRSVIEIMFGHNKQNRRFCTRFDKTMSSFRGFICLAAIKLWLPSFVNRT